MKDPKFAKFYLLSEIHKRLQNVPRRPVISNAGFYTENISSFLDHHLQPLDQSVKSYIKDINEFLKKLGFFQSYLMFRYNPTTFIVQKIMPFIFCTIDVVGLYPNIQHEEGLSALKTTQNPERKICLN